ncbi:hypothetical protein L1049_013536 [Liquidambar formosana]|uniref:Dirigent protein n=1 Tax=Liquidambar formosana TaxID=63359 RepID=A0AAP0RKZ2_LIQFO
MASLTSTALKATLHLLLLAITLQCANTARILDEVDIAPPVPSLAPESNPIMTSVANVAPSGVPLQHMLTHNTPHCPFSLHDILGASTPSARVVAGIISNTQVNGLPFSKPNDGIFPITGGVPLVNWQHRNHQQQRHNKQQQPPISRRTWRTIINNNGNNNVVADANTLPFVTAGQLLPGATLQKLMFGTITVVDDELTQGHELGSVVVGKAQGFYLASSLDGSSQTVAFTALFHNGDHEEDTLSFFGVHRTAAVESQIAIVGGSGKYENAKGYAIIQTVHLTDQHTTDGVETLLQFSVSLSQ